MYVIGDIVKYQGRLWEVGFVNKLKFRGTLRLQESGIAGARQINYIDPARVRLFERSKKLAA